MTEARAIAIETSGRHGSVALGSGGRVVAEGGFTTTREHARALLPMVDGLCREQGWTPSEIGQCHVSIGPGSFTGLRVAVAFARHLALAARSKVVAVPTLDVIAENGADLSNPPARLAVILDAKRRQVFAAVYDWGGGGYRRVADPRMIEPGVLLGESPRPVAVIGEGIEYHREAVEASAVAVLDESVWWPRASNVLRLGWRLAEQGRFTAARDLAPSYVRRPEAEELWEKRHGKPGGEG